MKRDLGTVLVKAGQTMTATGMTLQGAPIKKAMKEAPPLVPAEITTAKHVYEATSKTPLAKKTKQASFTIVHKTTGLNPDYDRKAQKRRRDQQALTPYTTWPGVQVTKNHILPGSPCYNLKASDVFFHQTLPALLHDNYPKAAGKWAKSSPRWGTARRFNRGNRVISPPWAAGQVKLEGDSKSRKEIIWKGKTNIGHVAYQGKKVDIHIAKQYRNRGFHNEVLYEVERNRPDLKKQVRKKKLDEIPWQHNPRYGAKGHAYSSAYYYRRQNGKQVRVKNSRGKRKG